MAALIITLVILAVAVLAPLFGTDTSAGARYEDAPDGRGWWPAGPDARLRPRY
jgi:hypothetical protein